MAHSDTGQIRLRAAKEDEGQFALLVLTVAAGAHEPRGHLR